MVVIDKVVTVKLGGSLITDKTTQGVLRKGVLKRLAQELARSQARLNELGVGLVVGHGSGSFGHVAAQAVGYDKGDLGRRSVQDSVAIQAAALELHQHVLNTLRSVDLPCFSLQPASFLLADGGVVRLAAPLSLAPLEEALRQGLVPVVFGDVILDSQFGYTIASTESVLTLIVALISKEFSVREALWFGETDGVLGQGAQTLASLDAVQFEKMAATIGSPRGSDVTGGMLHRLDTVFRFARLGTPSRLLNGLDVGALEKALDGRDAGGTFVRADPTAGPRQNESG